MSDDRYCWLCYNTAELDCYCGGDFCVRDRGGYYDCPDCSRANGFMCDEIDNEET